MTNIMTIENRSWKRFCKLLEGKEGCNFTKDAKGEFHWKCKAGKNKDLAKKILKKYFPDTDIRKSMAYFERHGGYCDCEILLNVEEDAKLEKERPEFWKKTRGEI